MKKHIKTYDELSTKQQRFVDYYDGNATQAADKAGYKNPRHIGSENMAKLDIIEAIKNRENRKRDGNIATREERQKWWTEMMAKAEKDSDRLKASELLGRSEADFTDNIRTPDIKDANWTVTMVKPKE